MTIFSGSDLKLAVQDALDDCTPEQLRNLAEITLLLRIGQNLGCLDSFLTLLGFKEVSAE